MEKLQGLAGAPGQAAGTIVKLNTTNVEIIRQNITDTDAEIARFRLVQRAYIQELDELYETTLESLGQTSAEIFNAYKLIASDEYFFGNVIQNVQNNKINIDYAIEQEKNTTCNFFLTMEDAYMKERGTDIANVCNDLIGRLNGIESTEKQIRKIKEPFIVIAEDLTPADTIRIDKTYLKGFATEKGGVTSHTVILAKTLGIPAIVGIKDLRKKTLNGEKIYINGYEGYVYLSPDEGFLTEFAKEKERLDAQDIYYKKLAGKKITTLDSRKVQVCMNSGDSESLNSFNADNCDGIGLFRTEFIYMGDINYPSEDKQFNIYRTILEKASGKEVIIRTLDIGGDKQLDYMELPSEANPFLGYRAIRLCLDRKDVFKTQLRALLRASIYGNLKIMFPMIVTVEELRAAKELLETAKNELRTEGISFFENIPVGIMIETPAAVLISDRLATEADFFSIGTNDLIQYTTATDRMNEKVQYLYTSRNISVLTAIAKVIENGHAAGIPVGMCGETASDLELVPVLLGLGLDEFSMVSAQIGRVKDLISRLNYSETQAFAQQVLKQQTIAEVNALLKTYLK